MRNFALQALKNFLAVDKHFADFVEDQFDFHSYCTRKMTLRAYIAMLRTEDDIYHNPYFFKVVPLRRTCWIPHFHGCEV